MRSVQAARRPPDSRGSVHRICARRRRWDAGSI